MRELDIGVSFEDTMDTSFMDSIMQSGIADSGLESNGDVFYEDKLQAQECLKEESAIREFEYFLESCGISTEEFRDW